MESILLALPIYTAFLPEARRLARATAGNPRLGRQIESNNAAYN